MNLLALLLPLIAQPAAPAVKLPWMPPAAEAIYVRPHIEHGALSFEPRIEILTAYASGLPIMSLYTNNYAVGHTISTVIETHPAYLMIEAGRDGIRINCRTGEVKISPELTIDQASHEFWTKLAQAFPMVREAMLAGQPKP